MATKARIHDLAGLAVWLGLFVLVAPAAGQTAVQTDIDDLKRLSVEELLQYKVTSVSLAPEAWNDAAGSIFLIRGMSARAVGASRLPDLLRLAPNLFVGQATSSSWGVSARGFMRPNAAANKLLVLVDGRTVYSPLFSNVFWEAQDVFLPDMQSIEIISGPAGSTWGSNAVNGVINIVSKPAHDTLGTLVYAGGGREEATAGVRYGGRVGREGAFRVYAKSSAFDSTYDAAGFDDGADDWTFHQTGFRTDFGRRGLSEWVIQGDAFRGRYGNGARGENEADGANVMLKWRRYFQDDTLFAQFYHDYVLLDLNGDYRARTVISDFEFKHRRELTNTQQLMWGAGYRLIDDEVLETEGLAILPDDLKFELWSLFGQYKRSFFNREVDFTAGLRLEHNHFTGWESQPNLRVAWRPDRNHLFWASLSRTTRTPSRLETGFFLPEEPPYVVVGNPDFKSEILTAGEIGWRGQPTATVSLTSTLFWHDYDQLRGIEFTDAGIITQGNGVAGRSKGVELFVDWDAADWWRIRFGGFLIDQDEWVRPGSTDLEGALGETSYPEYQLMLRSGFRLHPDWNLWLSLRHVDEVPTYEDGYQPVPAYTELDVRLSWRMRPGVEFGLTGRNLLNESHPEIGQPSQRREVRRSIQGTLRWEF